MIALNKWEKNLYACWGAFIIKSVKKKPKILTTFELNFPKKALLKCFLSSQFEHYIIFF
jgi:hypothetical protein